ncbi:MAG: sulfite exporter TauE/SafE family protein [Bacteroidota bacterium]
MDPVNILILGAAGVAGGFVAGLLGVGGGIIFAPVLFFFYSARGVDPDLIAPLTLGTSLFCTLVTALAGTATHWGAGLIGRRVAVVVGAFSAAAVVGMTLFVTTQPWYSGRVFQIVLAAILLGAVYRMVTGKRPKKTSGWRDRLRTGTPFLAATGAAAGSVASAAGVGGGIVLVPAYNQLLRLPLKTATATSLATIILISFSGVAMYAATGLAVETPPTALGYVDFGQAVWMVLPALVTARLGVKTAERVNVRLIRFSFAGLAVLVAGRLLWRAFGG